MSKLLTNYLGFFSVLISVLSLVNIIYCYYFNIYLNIDHDNLIDVISVKN